MAEFCIAEFALAIGRSTDAGRAVIAAAVELKYRLPRTWARVQAGDLEAWRARRIAEATFGLTQEAAAFVDAQVAPFAHRIGIAALERLVAEAIARFMPDQALADAARRRTGRHFTIEHQQVSFNGTSQIHGELDLADALDLDAALAQGAEALRALGSTESLDVRRSSPPARSPATSSPSTSPHRATSQPRPGREQSDPSRGRWCCTCTSPTQRSPGPATVWSWRGWRTSARWSPPTRSAPGAPTPTPRCS